MIRTFLQFLLVFSLVTGGGFFVHLQVFQNAASVGSIQPLWVYYLVNYCLGLITVAGLLILSKSKGHLVGFAFMGGSLLKFTAFFIFFYPDLLDQPGLRKQEFISFFVPYALTLIAEVWFLVRYLNRHD